MKKKFLLPVILLLLLLVAPFSLKAAEYTFDNNIEEQNGIEIVKLVVGEGEDTTFSIVFKQAEQEETIEGVYTVDAETGSYILTPSDASLETLEVLLNNETGKFEFVKKVEEPPLEEELPPVIEEPEIVYPATVVYGQYLYGDVLADIEYGNIGDVVTVYAKPYSLCKVISVSINGVELTPNQDGNYQFTLTEGENLIDAKFEIDQEQMKYIVGMIENAKEGNWEEVFSIKNLFTIISWVISALMGSGFLITLLKNKKIETNTKVDVVGQVKDVLNSNSLSVVKEFLENTLQPIVNNIKSDNVATKEVVTTLARCFMLSQENTPESRLAIINELTKVQNSSNDLAQQVKELINIEIIKNNQEKEEKKQVLQELEQINENLGVVIEESEPTIVEKTVDDEMKGRY